MAQSKSKDHEKKNLGLGKMIIIAVLAFSLVPISVVTLLYFTNENFQYKANQYFSTIPGFAGKYFQSFPTAEERENQKKQISKYLLEIDLDRAVDKLMLLKKEDPSLYDQLAQKMAQMDAKRTTTILETIRIHSLKKDILISTLEQMDQEKEAHILDRAKYYETLSLPNLISEVKDELLNESRSYREMGLILEQMKENAAVEVLNNLEETVASEILTNFESREKEKKLRETIKKVKDQENNLKNIAQIYNYERPEELIGKIGNTKKYKTNELSIIYRNMDIVQTARILSEIKERDFVDEILKQIKQDEIIANAEDRLTKDIVKGMDIFSQYNRKVDELVAIYSKIQPPQIAEMITTLFKSKNNFITVEFENKESLNITEQELAIAIIRNLPEKTVAQVLIAMDSDSASDISKKIALPN